MAWSSVCDESTTLAQNGDWSKEGQQHREASLEDAVVQVRGHLAQEVKIEVMRGSQIPGESGGG